ncbi:hypothetical protein CK216_17225 [Mesorhizobium sp. WSM3876]|nr:hypothetical protein CK216_17225 [Mesorhizobium sp. WSM3876]
MRMSSAPGGCRTSGQSREVQTESVRARDLASQGADDGEARADRKPGGEAFSNANGEGAVTAP